MYIYIGFYYFPTFFLFFPIFFLFFSKAGFPTFFLFFLEKIGKNRKIKKFLGFSYFPIFSYFFLIFPRKNREKAGNPALEKNRKKVGK